MIDLEAVRADTPGCLDSVVRASPHYVVSPSQLDQTVEAVTRLG